MSTLWGSLAMEITAHTSLTSCLGSPGHPTLRCGRNRHFLFVRICEAWATTDKSAYLYICIALFRRAKHSYFLRVYTGLVDAIESQRRHAIVGVMRR